MAYKVLVTGASSGIGRETALALAEKGHTVLMAARRREKIEETFHSHAELKDRLLIAELDVTQPASVDRFMSEQADFLRGLDVLVNNAGLALGRESFQECELSDVEQMIQTNVMGVLRMTRKILPTMIARRWGHILNLGSVAGLQSYTSGTVYCASKAAVHMITDCLRLDLAGTGVRVSTIAPGRVAETEFSTVRFRGDQAKANAVYEGFRTMNSRDVAEAIVWMIERPRHINIQEVLLMSTDQPDARSVAPVKED
jgi:3-hydroxy acid dehydrogenase/malonic semialdehyde reductase